jgi:hypothetical protein
MTDEAAIFDFDQIEAWGPRLRNRLAPLLSADPGATIFARTPDYIEDAADILYGLTSRAALNESVAAWIKGQSVRGYHGTRLTLEERDAVLRDGLRPLLAQDRALRLRRSLSAHPRWAEVECQLTEALQLFGANNYAGRREGQVHLTVSRSGLVEGFNHYLRQGSEFDWHVAHHLLGEEGQALVSADGDGLLVSVLVPGETALDACDLFGQPSEGPNLVTAILTVWSWWLAYPDYQSADYGLDCGMIFRDAVPADWIDAVTALEPNA